MMQSSPPSRAWNRPPSCAESEYSLDMNALDLETQSDFGVPKPKVDRIFSEDIDGPSDFTQNMEAWMGGAPGSGFPPKPTKLSRQPIPEHCEERETEGPQRDVSAPSDPSKKQTGNENTREEPIIEPYSPAGRTQEQAEFDATEPEEPFSSEWQTYGTNSTPAPPTHRVFPQPTVEDWYSELSPTRQSLNQVLCSHSSQKEMSRKELPAKETSSVPTRAHRHTLSPAQSTVVPREEEKPEIERNWSSKGFRQEWEQQWQVLQARCQEVESLNRELVRALDEEKGRREQERNPPEGITTEASCLEKELRDAKVATQQQSDDFRRQFELLKDGILKRIDEAETARLGSETSGRNHGIELKRLNERLDLQQMEHEHKMMIVKQELNLARLDKASADEVARIRLEELQQLRANHGATIDCLKADVSLARADKSAFSGLEQNLVDARSEIQVLGMAKSEFECEIRELRTRTIDLKRSHQDEITRAIADRNRATELASSLQQQLKDLRQQLRDEQASHDAGTNFLTREHENITNISREELAIVRAELDAKQTELNEAILERDEARDMLESRQANNEDIQIQLDDMKTVNAKMDAMLTERLHKRDAYWREKLEEADRERSLMAKELLHQWGREEVGISSPQMYAYKYLTTKRDPHKSQTNTRAAA